MSNPFRDRSDGMAPGRDAAGPADRHAALAAGLIRRVFRAIQTPLAFRLWDGTAVDVGPTESPFAVVFRSRGVFRRVFRRPTPLRFGEAYIEGELDIEGDMFAAMRAADAIEHVRLPLGTRVTVLVGLLRV